MRLSDDIYEYIKQEVIDLFVRYDIRRIPISGDELAKKIGMTLIPYSALSKAKLEEVKKVSPDGFYMEPGDGKEYIFYEDDMEYERQNMTILHETGHGVLGHNNTTDPAVAEAEAAFFAKYAAAPPPLVHRIRPTTPEEIQNEFAISYEAACYALSYYHKWLRHSEGNYAEYEIRLLNQFAVAG